MKREKKTWFTSDSHYNHTNIARGESKWPANTGQRDFDTVDEMNRIIVERFNEVVHPDDEVYHIGDWAFGSFTSIKEFWSKLKCKNIHLILGNHDKDIDRNRDGIQGLFRSVSKAKEIRIEGQHIVLSHYAHQVWNRSHHGSWMLYGHSHGTLGRVFPSAVALRMLEENKIAELKEMLRDEKLTGKTLDVGVDSHNFYPWSFQELKEEMATRKTPPWDRHADHGTSD